MGRVQIIHKLTDPLSPSQAQSPTDPLKSARPSNASRNAEKFQRYWPYSRPYFNTSNHSCQVRIINWLVLASPARI